MVCFGRHKPHGAMRGLQLRLHRPSSCCRRLSSSLFRFEMEGGRCDAIPGPSVRRRFPCLRPCVSVALHIKSRLGTDCIL